jgi:uncharacterized protein YegP (UPF0339 family)
MIKNRIIYAVWLIVCTALFILVNNVATFILLVLSVALPVIFIVIASISHSKITVDISVNDTAKKGEQVKGTAVIKNDSVFPAFSIDCKIKCKNLLNSRSEYLDIVAPIKSKGESSIDFNISSKYAGKIELSVKNVILSDLFKLSAFKINEDNILNTIISVSPEIFDSEIMISDEEYASLDSDVYSMEKAGNDSSETFMIREYVAGDSIKNIHFKLSQKVDKLMVRELGLPIVNDVLLLFDMSYYSGGERISPKSVDVLIDCFSTIAVNMIDSSINYTAVFKDSNSGVLHMSEITSHDDALQLIDSVMSNTFKADDCSIADFFVDNSVRKNYQHIVLITPNESIDVSSLCNYNRVNVLLLSENNVTLNGSGAFVTAFSKNDYKSAISVLEI